MHDVKNCSHGEHGCSFFLEIVRENLPSKIKSPIFPPQLLEKKLIQNPKEFPCRKSWKQPPDRFGWDGTGV